MAFYQLGRVVLSQTLRAPNSLLHLCLNRSARNIRNALPTLHHFSSTPHPHFSKYTDSCFNNDHPPNIVSAIAQKTSGTTYAILYQSNFHDLINLMLSLEFQAAEIITLFTATPSLLGYSTESLEEIINFFYNEGFTVQQILTVLEKNPDVENFFGYIRENILFLRDVIVIPGPEIQRILTSNPALLRAPASLLAANFETLMRIFRRSDILKMLRRQPLVLLQGEKEVMDKIEYVNHVMGLSQIEMILASILSHPLKHIRTRHLCIVRTGRYEKPDRRGATMKPNPFLKDILLSTDAEFVKLAGITVQELHVVEKMIEVESQEKAEDFLDDLDDDDEGNENGYKRERVMKDRMKKKKIQY